MPDHQFHLKTEHLTIDGQSRAGHETYFRVQELGVALDIGRCPDFLIPLPNVLITHAHLDHSVGIPFYAGQRHLQQMPGGLVFVPAEAQADFEELMRIHERLEGTSYSITFVGMGPGDERPLGRNHLVRAHLATHRVPARGYEIIERRHHLRAEYAGADGQALALLRRDGVIVEESADVPLLFYTGDTDAGIFEASPALFRTEVLMIECSFIGEGHENRAARYRHIHFDDIAAVADRFENTIIILTHFSKRYAPPQIVATLRRRCPPVLRERLHLALPEGFRTL